MGYLDDAYRELAEVNAFKARDERARARADSITPDIARRANETAERYPYLTAGALMAMVRGGFPEDSDNMIERLNTLSIKRWYRDHPNGQRYGAPTDTPGVRRGVLAPGMEFVESIKQRRFQKDLAALPAHLRKQFEDANTTAEAAGIFDSEGFIREPDRMQNEQRAAFDRLSKAYLDAGQNLDFLDLAGNPKRLHGKYSESGYTHKETGKWLMSTHSPGQLQELDPKVVERRRAEAHERVEQQYAGSDLSGAESAVKSVMLAFDAPVQELQGQIRNIYGAVHGENVDWLEPQSDLGIMLDEGLTDTGSGYFVDPESEVAVERRRREAERGQIGGHNVTAGRWFADTLPFAPDTKPFQLASGLVDLGVQIVEPTGWALGGAGKAAQTRKLFNVADMEESAGLIRGLRNVLAGPTVQRWLDSDDGVRRIQWLADHNSPHEIAMGLNRKVNLDLARRLADTRSTDEVRTILQKELGTSIKQVSTVAMPGSSYNPMDIAAIGKDPLEVASKIKEMPARGPIDAWDKDLIGYELEKWLFNAKADQATIAKHFDQVARAEDSHDLNAAIRDAIRSAESPLRKQGISEEMTSKLLRLHEDAYEEGSRTWWDTVTRQGQSDNVIKTADGEAWDTMAHLYVEQAPRHISLPDARDIRRVVSDYPTILKKATTTQTGKHAGELRIGFHALEELQNRLWKPFQLATRIAWPVRVIAEEQVRMAAAGYDSMFNHPIKFIGWRVAKEGKLVEPKGDLDMLGAVIREADEHTEGMARTHGGWVERSVPTGINTSYRKRSIHERQEFKRAWGSEISKLAHDPVAKVVANSDLDAAKAWFTRGGGNKFRASMAKNHRGKFDTIDQAEAYIESVDRRIRNAHGGNDLLLETIKTGKFDGHDILDAGVRLDQQYLDNLDGLIDEYAPEQMVGERFVSRGESRTAQAWNGAVDRLFGMLMTNRTNNLSRSIVFRQHYWKEAERLLPFVKSAERGQIIDMAKQANIGSRAIRRMERTAQRKVSGELTIKEADLLAKGDALDNVKELLYDLTRKGRTMDAMRLVFPFGEAWNEVITRWFGIGRNPLTGRKTQEGVGLVWKNPKTVRRFQQLLQGARGQELGDFTGAPEGEGFFWENSFGEQVFAYPGTQLLNDALIDVPVPLTGRVQGLSMFGTVIPGLGPVTQIPVGWFLQNRPGPESMKRVMTDLLDIDLGPLGTVQEQVLPFGSIGAQDQSAILRFDTYMPPWVKSAFQAVSGGDINGRQWNTTVMEMAGYLKSTGEYGASADEQSRLFENAATKASQFYFIKAIAGTAAPASPDREWMVEQNNGKLVRAAVLAEEWRKMTDEDFSTAGKRFLDKYGEDLMGVIGTSMTTSSNYATPGTKDGVRWVEANPGIEDELPKTFGFFAPETGEMDLSMYNDNFRKGESIRLNPRTWIRLQNDTIGSIIYREALREVGEHKDTDAGRAYLAAEREKIWDQYPGWQDESGELNKPATRDMVKELYEAVDHPAIRGTDAGKGLSLYLGARDQIVSYVESLEGNRVWPSEAKDLEDARAFLAESARKIINRHPDFERVYDFVLSRETEIGF